MSFGQTGSVVNWVSHGIATQTIVMRRSDAAGAITSSTVSQPGSAAFIATQVFDGANARQTHNSCPTCPLAAMTSRSPAADLFTIGQGWTSGLGAWNGEIGDILIFAGAHDVSTSQLIERWLASQYGWTVLYGVDALSAANYYSVAAGEAGSASGFGFGMLFAPEARTTAASATRTMFGRMSATGANGGYQIRTTSTIAAMTAQMRATSGTAISSPTQTFATADIGKLCGAFAWHDTARVRLMVNRSEVGNPGTAITGYTAAISGLNTRIGLQSDGVQPADLTSVYGAFTFSGTPSVAQLQAVFDSIKTNGQIPTSMPGMTITHVWDPARDVITGLNKSLPDPFADRVGVNNLAKAGTPALSQLIETSWPW